MKQTIEEINSLIEESPVRSVAKALAIVEVMKSMKTEVTLSMLSYKLGMAKSTIYGLLNTLKVFGYIQQSPINGTYKIGTKFYEVGCYVESRWDVKKIANPYIEELSVEIDETIHLAVLDDYSVLYIGKNESNKSIRIVSKEGIKLPAYCTGIGKVILAYLPDKEICHYLKNIELEKFAKNTITDKEKLKKELCTIKRNGFAYDNEEIMNNLFCIAMPIYNQNGEVHYAISIAMQKGDDIDDKIETYKEKLYTISMSISSELGYRV